MKMEEFCRCLTCRGTKEVMGLGLFPQKCTNCDGIGWTKRVIEDVADVVTDAVNTVSDIVDAVVKPKKVKAREERRNEEARD
jgi:hypothetical protein